MDDLAEIDGAIGALEGQRAILGDRVVDVALRPLFEKRAGLIGRAAGEQRKLVTVLFADVVDFTVMSRQLDAEDVRNLIDAYFAEWRRCIEERGGVVEKFIGDAVMAVFGIERAEEQDPHQAIRAALSMGEALGDLNEAEAATYGVRLQMRVGIDTGDVVVSTLGDRGGQDFVVVGDVVNRASRIQGAAPPGGVLVSADTYRHVRGSFAVQPMTGLHLKGIDAPVDAFLVDGERPRGFRLDSARGVEGVDTRTIGRDTELRELQDRYRDVAEECQWQVVSVIGDAGLGKSRLLTEFAGWLDALDEPVWWFRGGAAHAGRTLPYAVLHDMFAARFDINDSDDPSEVTRKWRDGIAQALGDETVDVADQACTIAVWLGFGIDDDAGRDLRSDPKGLSDRATACLAEYFRRLADVAPVVLLLEDLHWADEAMLALIDAADAVFRDSRVLVVATARPSLLERHPHWGEGLDFHGRVTLTPLSRRETRQLLVEVLQRVEHVPDTLSDLVVAGSEGNPFYVEELVKVLLESGVITKHDTTWRVEADRLEQLRVPPTLRSVLQARLDALSPEERLALQRASVIGRTFWDAAVHAISGEQDRPAFADATGAALDRLREREVVYQREQSTFEGTREYLFKHALLRDVAYEGVLRRHRRAYHSLAAGWFEHMAERTRRSGEYAGLIAEHHAAADDGAPAARWFVLAGQQAMSVHGLEDAMRLLERGLEVVPAAAVLERFDLHLAHEEVLDRLGDRTGQDADLDALGGLVAGVDDPARQVRLLLTRARRAFHQSRYQDQAQVATEAIAVARAGGLDDLVDEATMWLGKGLAWEGKHEASRVALDRALAGARARGQRPVVTEALRYLAIVATNVGENRRAEALLAEAIAMHQEDGDRDGEAVAQVQLATVLYNSGRIAEARTQLEGALPVVVASGFRYREAIVVSNLASIVLLEGEFGRARELITRGLALCEELEDIEGMATALNILGDLYRRAGDIDGAEGYLRRSIEIAPRAGFEIVAGDTLVMLALLAAQRGRLDEARAHADDAVDRARRATSGLAEGRARIARGYVELAAGRPDAAVDELQAARTAMEHLDLDHFVIEVDAALARAAFISGDTALAVTLAGRVLDALGRVSLLAAIEPSEVYRSCWRVLADCGDPRAADALAAGQSYLAEMATRIGDEELLASFRNRIPANVDIARGVAAG